MKKSEKYLKPPLRKWLKAKERFVIPFSSRPEFFANSSSSGICVSQILLLQNLDVPKKNCQLDACRKRQVQILSYRIPFKKIQT